MAAGLYLCNLDELAENSAKGFDPTGQGKNTMFVVRKGSKLVAYKDACPHYQGSTTLPWRKDAYLDSKAEFIVCAAHGAEFEIDSGLCVQGPCIGESLLGVALRIESDGRVFLEN